MSDRKVPFKKLVNIKTAESREKTDPASNKISAVEDDFGITDTIDTSVNTSYQTLLQNSCKYCIRSYFLLRS